MKRNVSAIFWRGTSRQSEKPPTRSAGRSSEVTSHESVPLRTVQRPAAMPVWGLASGAVRVAHMVVGMYGREDDTEDWLTPAVGGDPGADALVRGARPSAAAPMLQERARSGGSTRDERDGVIWDPTEAQLRAVAASGYRRRPAVPSWLIMAAVIGALTWAPMATASNYVQRELNRSASTNSGAPVEASLRSRPVPAMPTNPTTQGSPNQPPASESPASVPEMVPTDSSPVAPSLPQTSGATATCEDGSASYSATHSGTCSGHGGVGQWLDGSSPYSGNDGVVDGDGAPGASSAASPSYPQSSGSTGRTWVNSYTRKDGTRVSGYYRR